MHLWLHFWIQNLAFIFCNYLNMPIKNDLKKNYNEKNVRTKLIKLIIYK